MIRLERAGGEQRNRERKPHKNNNRPATPAGLLFLRRMLSARLFSPDQLGKPLLKHAERFVLGIRSLEYNLQDLLAQVAFAGFDSFDAARLRAIFDSRLRMRGNAVGP